MNDLNLVQQEILTFIKNIGNLKEDQTKEAFLDLRNKLLQINKMPYQKRPFLYLDIVSWLESKIYNKSVQEIIKSKFKSR
ncbi:MAG TPA: hypothetical protein DCL80_00360 [Balneola sp.]|nr:hypothetical protein [Balneola sp.]